MNHAIACLFLLAVACLSCKAQPRQTEFSSRWATTPSECLLLFVLVYAVYINCHIASESPWHGDAETKGCLIDSDDILNKFRSTAREEPSGW